MLANVVSFKYHGRLLMATNYECKDVVVNIQKVWKNWAQMSRILGQEGADTRTSSTLFDALVQDVLLFGL